MYVTASHQTITFVFLSKKQTCVDERESQLLLHTCFAVFADPPKLLSQKKGPGPIGPQGCYVNVKVTTTYVLRILIFFF